MCMDEHAITFSTSLSNPHKMIIVCTTVLPPIVSCSYFMFTLENVLYLSSDFIMLQAPSSILNNICNEPK